MFSKHSLNISNLKNIIYKNIIYTNFHKNLLLRPLKNDSKRTYLSWSSGIDLGSESVILFKVSDSIFSNTI